MPGTVEAAAKERGITIPTAATPAANYVPFVRTGSYLYVSGQVAMVDGTFPHTGKLGGPISLGTGYECARICGLNLIAVAKLALGDLDKVTRVVKLVGFVNSEPSFSDQPKVINGASDLMVEVFGDAGRHARSAVGVAALPFDVPVEVEGIFEVAD